MRIEDLAGLALTYTEVGATAGSLPAGYRHLRESALIGHGRQRFDAAAAAVMRWGMLRGAGLRVHADSEVAEPGAHVIVGLGPFRVPCRVVYAIDEPDRRGFAYGTLPGHGESGEELFAVRYDPADDGVYAEVTAFSRHATWWSGLVPPVTTLVQRYVTGRYLKAL